MIIRKRNPPKTLSDGKVRWLGQMEATSQLSIWSRHGRVELPAIEIVGAWPQSQDQDEDRDEDVDYQDHVKGWYFPARNDDAAPAVRFIAILP